MTQPTKAAVSRMTRLILVFAMILSLVGGFLYSAQAKSIYNIKADSNVVTTVEGVSPDADSPVVDQILEQAGIEVSSSDIVEVTVTSDEPEESSSSSDEDSASSASFVSGVASEQVVQSLAEDASSPAAQNEEQDAPDSREAEKESGKQSEDSSEEQSGKQSDENEEKDASSEDQSQTSEAQTEAEALNGSLAEVKAMDTALPQDDGAESSAPQDDESEAEQTPQQESEDQKSPKAGEEQQSDASDTEQTDEAASSDEEQKADGSASSDEEQKADGSASSDEEQKVDAPEAGQSADNVEQDPADSSSADESTQVSGDKIITVTVTRPKYVTVTVDKTLTSVQLQPGDTVRDVVERLNIVLGENDLVSQSLDAEPDPSEPITINRVQLSYFEKVKTKDYKTIRKPDSKKYIGTEYVKREGVPYKKVDTYEKKIIDGGKPIITKVKTDVTEMKEEIVCYGTKVDSPSPSGLSASHNVITNRDEENGTITLSDGSTYSYSSVSTSFAATAYCGGGTTSTGRAAQVGVVAVDPSVIPYGTRMYITSGSIVYGVCVAGDTGVSGHLIDLYFNSASHCRAFGRRGITVYFLD